MEMQLRFLRARQPTKGETKETTNGTEARDDLAAAVRVAVSPPQRSSPPSADVDSGFATDFCCCFQTVSVALQLRLRERNINTAFADAATSDSGTLDADGLAALARHLGVDSDLATPTTCALIMRDGGDSISPSVFASFVERGVSEALGADLTAEQNMELEELRIKLEHGLIKVRLRRCPWSSTITCLLACSSVRPLWDESDRAASREADRPTGGCAQRFPTVLADCIVLPCMLVALAIGTIAQFGVAPYHVNRALAPTPVRCNGLRIMYHATHVFPLNVSCAALYALTAVLALSMTRLLRPNKQQRPRANDGFEHFTTLVAVLRDAKSSSKQMEKGGFCDWSLRSKHRAVFAMIIVALLGSTYQTVSLTFPFVFDSSWLPAFQARSELIQQTQAAGLAGMGCSNTSAMEGSPWSRNMVLSCMSPAAYKVNQITEYFDVLAYNLSGLGFYVAEIIGWSAFCIVISMSSAVATLTDRAVSPMLAIINKEGVNDAEGAAAKMRALARLEFRTRLHHLRLTQARSVHVLLISLRQRVI